MPRRRVSCIGGPARCWRSADDHAAAVRSFCRAQDWDSVREIIRIGGHDLAADHGSWLDLIPEQIRRSDPWVMLAVARRLLADGSLTAAAESYAAAVEAFDGMSGTETAERELTRRPGLGNTCAGCRRRSLPPAPVGLRRSGERARSRPIPRRSDGAPTVSRHSGRVGWPRRPPRSTPRCGRQTSRRWSRRWRRWAIAVALTMLGDSRANLARQRAGMIASAVELPGLERVADGLIRLLEPADGRGSRRAGRRPARRLPLCRRRVG